MLLKGYVTPKQCWRNRDLPFPTSSFQSFTQQQDPAFLILHTTTTITSCITDFQVRMYPDIELVRTVVTFLFLAIEILTLLAYRDAMLGRRRMSTTNRDSSRREVLFRLLHESDRFCHEQLRMRRAPFFALCVRLRHLGLADSMHVSVEEQVALFLHTIAHDLRNRKGALQYCRSGETVSKCFHAVLRVLLCLFREVVTGATTNNSPDDYDTHHGWHSYFQDVVGAIDGTHIQAYVPIKDQGRYCNRHKVTSQNVLVACSFDMRFTYVLAGWEGSAHDGRVFRDAVTRQGARLTVPPGKYYLGDAGFPSTPGVLVPYRGVRYHLCDQGGQAPNTPKEMFNFRHSSLRTVVERTIGILKKRFAYLRHQPFHGIETQVDIVLACCALHNFVREEDASDTLDDEPDDPNQLPQPPMHRADADILVEINPLWQSYRDEIRDRMWAVPNP